MNGFGTLFLGAFEQQHLEQVGVRVRRDVPLLIVVRGIVVRGHQFRSVGLAGAGRPPRPAQLIGARA